MNGVCIRCGRQMKWTGHIWLCCNHCGQMQVWPTSERSQDVQVQGKEMWEVI